ATKESVDALSDKLTTSNEALSDKLTISNRTLSDKLTTLHEANTKAIESMKDSIKPLATKESVDALIASVNARITDSNKANTKANDNLVRLLFFLITLYAAERGVQIYDAPSNSPSPTPIESADPNTPKQLEPSPDASSATDAGASSATVSGQTLETNSKTITPQE
nr:hypothetical protein [Pseudomonadota bacterium]